ncbi:hypothetical protein Mapa_002943 [Marchantia paleacea]|nr:hypothetical protein Mapa_002943 [Marchantia paleacea]
MLPLSRLEEKSSDFSDFKALPRPPGMGPERLLPLKRSVRRREHAVIRGGMSPTKPLLEMSKCWRLTRRSTLGGRGPDRLLLWRKSVLRKAEEPKRPTGSDPKKALSCRFSRRKLVRLLRSSTIRPSNLLLGREICSTLWLAAPHEIPVQLHGVASLWFQLSSVCLGSSSTALLKASSANPSEFSPEVPQIIVAKSTSTSHQYPLPIHAHARILSLTCFSNPAAKPIPGPFENPRSLLQLLLELSSISNRPRRTLYMCRMTWAAQLCSSLMTFS